MSLQTAERWLRRRILAFAGDILPGKPKTDPDDRALMQRIAGGDPDAAGELVRLYADQVYRFVYHQVNGVVQDAEDITQEVFLAATTKAGRFRGGSRLRTWLFSIAAHKVADHWRREKRRRELLTPDHHAALDEAPSQQEILETAEVCQAVRAALFRLPPHYRTALVLQCVEDWRVADIARVMRRSVKSVESILVRARRMLAQILAEGQ